MPTQHAAGQVGHLGEARLLQHHYGAGRARAGAAHGHHRALAVKRGQLRRQAAERHQPGARDVPERAKELVGFAHVDDLHPRLGPQLRQGLRSDLPQAGEGAAHIGPARVGADLFGRFGPAAAQIRRHGHVESLGMRQIQIVHVAGEVALADLAAQARVVAPLFRHAGHRQAVVVMARVDQAGRRQREQLLMHGGIEARRAALLKIGAAAAADQQAVAAESTAFIVEHVTQAAVGVAGRGAHAKPTRTELDAVAVLEQAVRALGRSGARQGDAAA